jgi:hypothetical protein
MVVIVTITAFWDVMLCNLVDHYQCWSGTCSLHLLRVYLKMEAIGSSETLIMVYQIA